MKLEDLKDEFPETPAFIHKMITEEVERQVKTEKMSKVRGKKRGRWSVGKVAVAAAASCVAVSTVAFAGVRLYEMHLEQKGQYGANTKVFSSEVADKAEALNTTDSLSGKVPEVELKAEYIPKGMEFVEGAGDIRIRYKMGDDKFRLMTVFLDEENLKGSFNDRDVVESEETTFGNNKGIYLKKNIVGEVDAYNQVVYILFEEEKRVVILNVKDSVSKDDVYKVASGIRLQDTGKMVEISQLPSWSWYSGQDSNEGFKSIRTSVDTDKLLLHPVGETFKIIKNGEDDNGVCKSAEIDFSVDRVSVSDDLSLLDKTIIPSEWRDAIDKNGKLVWNTLSYIRQGDGINSTDEVIRTEKTKQKLLLVSVSYKNNSNVEVNKMVYSGNLKLLKKNEKQYEVFHYEKDESYGKVGDVYLKSSGIASPTYCGYKSKEEHISLKPSESIQVDQAWIVNEADLKNIYFDVNGGDSNGITEEDLQTGLVDIRQ